MTFYKKNEINSSFCGSSSGINSIYSLVAIQLGKYLVKQNLHLVYGGGKVGLMGIIADAVLQNGGEVTGVIPGFLMSKEVGHAGLTELIIVDTMHQRFQNFNDH